MDTKLLEQHPQPPALKKPDEPRRYASVEDLRKILPNIRYVGIGNKTPEKNLIEKCGNLIALAELYGFEDLVFSLEEEGYPVMLIDRGPKREDDPDGGRIVGKIYEDTCTGNMWAEGWDPREIGVGITSHIGNLEYYIDS